MSNDLLEMFERENAKASLAAEVASGLLDMQDILRNHGMTAAEMRKLMERDTQFRNQIREFRKMWNSPMSASDRVRAKAAIAVEDGLLELDAIFHDRDLNPTARIEAFKQMVALSDTAPKKDLAATGNSFTLNISLSEGESERREIVIESTPQLTTNTEASDTSDDSTQ